MTAPFRFGKGQQDREKTALRDAAPRLTVCLGITGHRAGNAAYAANLARIEAELADIFALIDDTIKAEAPALAVTTRMHSLLADGADQLAARMALSRGWKLICPLPFGSALNAAINAHAETAEDVRAIMDGRPTTDAATGERAQAILSLGGKARVFELADRDKTITRLLLANLDAPGDAATAQLLNAEISERAAFASRTVIEQSDIMIAVWDGAAMVHAGGTGHSIARSLELGTPVLWIDARAPQNWRILHAYESLATIHAPGPALADAIAELRALIREIVRPEPSHSGEETIAQSLKHERWHRRSNRLWHGYRRVEALFGGETLSRRFRRLTQTYESPAAIATGSAAGLLDHLRRMPGQDDTMMARIEQTLLYHFAWFDGVSTRLSDSYRGSMVINFLLAPLAIIAGIVYLPFFESDRKWMFALTEFALLASILALTALGRARRWHGRWFETRRVAEYLRHAPILLALGVSRSPGRWPRGVDSSWPEWFARQTLREVGLPHVAITSAYLRIALRDLLDAHVVGQRDYHTAKAKRLAAAHLNLDRFSGLLFFLAVVSVSIYLVLWGFGAFARWPTELSHHISHTFTFLGVFFPTFGGAIAGIRYFGDFERFSAISEVTAEKLDSVHARIVLLLAGPDEEIRYDRAAELARAADDIVISEIENWQAVFGGKHVTVPV